MGLFSRKLTSAQEAELQGFARILDEVREHWEEALIDIHSETEDLYYICRQALKENRELKAREYLLDVAGDDRHVRHVPRVQEEIVDINTLIERAKGAIQAYTDFLADVQAKVLSRQPANWYPKRYKREYAFCDLYFKRVLPILEAVRVALQPPGPLKHGPKHGSKLKAFVSALNSIAVFYQGPVLPVDFDLRAETERLRMP